MRVLLRFKKTTLAIILGITLITGHFARQVPHASKVQSLTTISVAQSIEDNLEISPLFETLPETAEELKALKIKVMNNPILNLPTAKGPPLKERHSMPDAPSSLPASF